MQVIKSLLSLLWQAIVIVVVLFIAWKILKLFAPFILWAAIIFYEILTL